MQEVTCTNVGEELMSGCNVKEMHLFSVWNHERGYVRPYTRVDDQLEKSRELKGSVKGKCSIQYFRLV